MPPDLTSPNVKIKRNKQKTLDPASSRCILLITPNLTDQTFVSGLTCDLQNHDFL